MCQRVDIFMRTSHNPVYPVHEVDDHALHVDSPERVNKPSKIPRVITDIVIKDYFFDTKERCRTKRRKAKSNEVSKPKDIARGVHGVRQNFSPDESKILPTTRLGIPLQ